MNKSKAAEKICGFIFRLSSPTFARNAAAKTLYAAKSAEIDKEKVSVI